MRQKSRLEAHKSKELRKQRQKIKGNKMKNLKVGDKKVFVNTDEEGVVEAMDTLELATADWAEAHWQYAVDTARWYSQWAQLPYVVDLGVTTLLPIAP